MNVTYLQTNADILIDHMRGHGYSRSYIKKCRRVCNYVITLSDELSWKAYDDVRSWISANEDLSERYRSELQFAVTVVEQFDVYQQLPVHPVSPDQMSFVSHSAGKLDLLPLQERMHEFEKALCDKGHKPQYVKKIKSFAAKIIITARTIRWDSFQEIQDYYQGIEKSEQTRRFYRQTIKKIERFLLGGKVPCHRNSRHFIEDAQPSLGKLDLYGLKERLPDLLNYMEDHNYSPNYIRRVSIKAERIIVQAGKVAWDSYQDVMDWYDSQQDPSLGYLGEIRTVIRLMSAFHLYGIYPNNHETQHPIWPRANNYQQLIPEYKEIVDFGCETQNNRGLKESSVDRARYEATAFFSFMQGKGISRLEDISEDDVLAFFHTGTSEMHRTKIPGLSLFMRDCIPLSPVEFRRIDSLLPITHTFRKTIQYLKSDESKAIQSVLEDMDNDLSLKQRAIGTIFFYNGMRSSDVANLKLDSVDLKRQLISFTQVKTGVPTTLPLLPVVGNAIYDYCTMERPESDSPYLFLGDQAPYHPMAANSMGWIVSKIMDRADIRKNKGDRRGTHIFRHRAATVMAENNIPAPVISATLGHTSPKALDSYLSADIVHLRECAIDISEYSIAEEVFDYD